MLDVSYSNANQFIIIKPGAISAARLVLINERISSNQAFISSSLIPTGQCCSGNKRSVLGIDRTVSVEISQSELSLRQIS